MAKVFISYSTADSESANRIYQALQTAGIDAWMSEHDIDRKRSWSESVGDALDNCEFMLLLHSPSSAASEHVRREWEYYLYGAKKKPIFVCVIKEQPLPYDLTTLNRLDFYKLPQDTAIQRLMNELKSIGALSPKSSDRILPPPFEWIEIPFRRITLQENRWKDSYIKLGTRVAVQVFQFEISKYPITNAQYELFIQEGGYTWKGERWWTELGKKARRHHNWEAPQYWDDPDFNQSDQPVVAISWYEAVAFCNWLSEVSDEIIRLPREEEWQRAAQGNDERLYAWGNAWDPRRCNGAHTHLKVPTPVTAYDGPGDSPFKVVDMCGNVAEWCLTAWDDGSEDLHVEKDRVVRGGSWFHADPAEFQTIWRDRIYMTNRSEAVGFRIVRQHKNATDSKKYKYPVVQ